MPNIKKLFLVFFLLFAIGIITMNRFQNYQKNNQLGSIPFKDLVKLYSIIEYQEDIQIINEQLWKYNLHSLAQYPTYYKTLKQTIKTEEQWKTFIKLCINMYIENTNEKSKYWITKYYEEQGFDEVYNTMNNKYEILHFKTKQTQHQNYIRTITFPPIQTKRTTKLSPKSKIFKVEFYTQNQIQKIMFFEQRQGFKIKEEHFQNKKKINETYFHRLKQIQSKNTTN